MLKVVYIPSLNVLTQSFGVVKFLQDNHNFYFRGYKQPWKLKTAKFILMFLRQIHENLVMQKCSRIGFPDQTAQVHRLIWTFSAPHMAFELFNMPLVSFLYIIISGLFLWKRSQ